MNIHNFVINKGENQEQKIEQEIDALRNSNKGFKLNKVNVIPNTLGSALVTLEYQNDK